MIKNKRADGAIVLLVLLVLLVTATALFVFLTNTWEFESKISDARVIEELYLKEELVKFYVVQAGEDAIEKTSNFEKDFKGNFKIGFAKYNFDQRYLNDMKKIISEGKFNIEVEGKILKLEIQEFELKDSFGKIEVTYSPKISVGFSVE